MARFVALEWDRLEVRVLVARAQGSDISVELAKAIPLSFDLQESNITGLDQQLKTALSQHKIPKGPTLVAIGRSLVELRTLKLPPAPEEELPDMVRFQAQREFSGLKPTSPLDFLPLGDVATEPGEVVAASVSEELRAMVKRGVDEVGYDVKRAILRPFAAASLAMRHVPQAKTKATLIISQMADSAELSVCNRGIVVFTRAFRLPPGWTPGEKGEPLLGEVRRTIAAAQNQLSGGRVEQIVLFGTQSQHAALSENIESRIGVSVELIDPLQNVISGIENAERYAALLGMLHDEATETRPAIDFVNPRRRPEPKSNTRLYVLMAAAAASVVIGLIGLVYWNYQQLDAQIASLQAKTQNVEKETRQLKPVVELAASLEKWKVGDRNWLEELRFLSDSETLSAEDFRLVSIQASALRGDYGELTVKGYAKDLAARDTFQNELDDEQHDAIPGRSSASAEDPRYPWEFSTVIRTSDFIDVPRQEPPATESAALTSSEANGSSADETLTPDPVSQEASPAERAATPESIPSTAPTHANGSTDHASPGETSSKEDTTS